MDSQSVLNDGYRQPETLQLAPDALVFINGSNLIEDPDGKTFDIRQDITEISTNLGIDSVPGTANFTISYPSHSGGNQGLTKYKNLKIMSEVEIYFRGRFPKQVGPEKLTRYPYYQAFWGMISSLSQNYSDGVNTISVSCVDILRWWQITNLTVNSSLMAIAQDSDFTKYLVNNFKMDPKEAALFLDGLSADAQGRRISIFSTIFSQMTIPQILEACANVSLLQMTPIKDYLSQYTKAEPISTTDRDTMISKSQMDYWANRLLKIGRKLRIYGLTINEQGVPDIDMTQLISTDDQYSTLTTKQLREITGSATTVYQMFPTAPPTAKSDRKSQLEIANEIKETIHYEFFMDVNGDIVFKPPFYNLDVSSNTKSIINDIDITAWNFVQSESEVVTRVDVSGALSVVSDDSSIINGIAYDPVLSLQFGERHIQRHMPWLHSSEQCHFWAKLELARLNSLITQGTISIIGRPELRLGYPVFVPSRDAFYYIKGIEHRLQFGGSFTTTLTICAERAQKGTKLGLFRNVGSITNKQVSVPGTLSPESDELNNFVKQMYMPNICTPRAKETVQSIRPNFTIDLTKTSSDIKGPYNLLAGQPFSEKSDIQITDSKGYSLIGNVGQPPYFTFGYGKKFDLTYQNTVYKNNVAENAAKANKLDPTSNNLFIDANNVMLTLDDTASRMIDWSESADIQTAASKALKIDISITQGDDVGIP
jgi:hypothetical protein